MKLCGRLEPCFEFGEQWGHFQGTLCKMAGETKLHGKNVGICTKDGKRTAVYLTSQEYKEAAKKHIDVIEYVRSVYPSAKHVYLIDFAHKNKHFVQTTEDDGTHIIGAGTTASQAWEDARQTTISNKLKH